MIDFLEIKTSHRWEQFAESFFCARGATILQRAALGQDGGADLIIQESVFINEIEQQIRILVSCKFSPKAIGIGIEQDILDRVIRHNCSGFYGFYSTNYTSNLQEKLTSLLINSNHLIQLYHFFDDYEIETFLKNNVENNLFKNNFEKSYTLFVGGTEKVIEKNTNFRKLSSEELRDKKNEDYKEFYSGELPQWSIIRKYTFKRDAFEKVTINLEKNKIALVTAAGGEGKTTFMMQIGCHFFDKKFEVYYSFDGISNIHINELQFDKRKNYLLLIDQANYLENLVKFIQVVKLKDNVKVLFGSRKNEWLKSMELSKQYKDIQILIGSDEFTLEKLSAKEINALGLLLQKHGVMHESSRNNFEQIISTEAKRSFLLATMLLATKGQKFEFYIADVINNIGKWENGYNTLKAIGYVVACEVLDRGTRGSIYCSEKLLIRLMEISQEKMHRIKKNLAEEAFFQGNANRLIHTRNPLIAQLYFDILFLKNSATLSLEDFYSSIIHECAVLNEVIYFDIIATIPVFLRKIGEKELGRKMVEKVVTYGYFFSQSIAFINDEIVSGNIGDYYNYSARWLCKKAYEKNPSFSAIYIEWVKIEKKYGQLGDFYTENSVRWIFKQGYDRNIDDTNFFIAWALTEIEVGNMGVLDGEKEFSARWILRKIFYKRFDIEVALVWAKLEILEGNFGDLGFEPEYSARWIFKKCFDKNKKKLGDFYLMWARLEIQLNNTGDLSFKIANTGRWLLKMAFDLPVTCAANLHWAKLELRDGNLGDIDCKKEYSARWILKKTIERDINDTLKKELMIYWAKVEAHNKNFGNYESAFSALYLLKSLYNLNMITPAGFSIWSAIQYYLDVPDSNDFSPIKLFEKAKDSKDKLFYQEENFVNFEDWKRYLQNHEPEITFKPAGFHYLTTIDE